MYEFINLTCFCGLVAGAVVLTVVVAMGRRRAVNPLERIAPLATIVVTMSRAEAARVWCCIP